MSEALLGVIVGGLLSGLGTWITLAVQHKRWSTEMRINRLQAKRERLEASSARILDELPAAMARGSYPSKMASEITVLFPENVFKTFDRMMGDKEKTELKMKHYYFEIALEMRKSIKALDEEIDAVTLGKS
jgi:hypothetical protein